MTTPTAPPDSSSLHVLPDGPVWHDVRARLPRRDQPVRVVTTAGIDQKAVFDVAFTSDWPSGATWRLAHGQHLPFDEVVSWCGDLDASPLKQEDPSDSESPPAPEPAAPPALIEEIRSEIERTKGVLRLLPQNVLDWSPHPSIPTLSTLALRTVRIAARIGWILDLDEVERSFEPDVPPFESIDQIFASYSANADEVFALLDEITGSRLAEPWQLLRNGALVREMSRGSALRWYGLTPLIHHRAEISLMLRALNVNPPHLYPGWAFTDTATGEAWAVPGQG